MSYSSGGSGDDGILDEFDLSGNPDSDPYANWDPNSVSADGDADIYGGGGGTTDYAYGTGGGAEDEAGELQLTDSMLGLTKYRQEDDDEFLYGDSSTSPTTEEDPYARLARTLAGTGVADTVEEKEEEQNDESQLSRSAIVEDQNTSKMEVSADELAAAGIPGEDDTANISEDVLLLRKHHIFRDVHWIDFYRLATRYFERVEIPQGKVLARQGSSSGASCGQSSHWCVVISGLIEVSRSGLVLSTLAAGESFGEQQVLYGQPAPATLTCKTTVKVWAVEKTLLARLKAAHEIQWRHRSR